MVGYRGRILTLFRDRTQEKKLDIEVKHKPSLSKPYA
jgi:hypothetical protein